jgi:hypothetical protein
LILFLAEFSSHEASEIILATGTIVANTARVAGASSPGNDLATVFTPGTVLGHGPRLDR